MWAVLCSYVERIDDDMGLITITAPGDVLGTISAVANAIAEIARAVQIANLTASDEERVARGKLFIEMTKGPLEIISKLNVLLKIDGQ